MNYTSRMLSEYLNNLRKGEENNLSSGAFVGRIAKGCQYSAMAVAVIGIGMGWFLAVPIQDPDVGMIFGALGLLSLLMLPTYLSYRCCVDKSKLKTTYYILCFRREIEVYWEEVAYKKVRRDAHGDALSICLYSADRKKLISFDYVIVGFGRVVRMAKRIPVINK